MSDFEKLINASDLIEWIIETDPDWCVGSVRSIIDHIDKMPSAQPFDEDINVPAKDCISRQAAIDALRRAEALTRAFGYHNVIETIRELPSVQPETHEERTETHACDLISVIKQTLDEIYTHAETEAEARYHAEIVRCKDCRYYQDNNGGYPHMNCKWDANETPDEDDFCSGAERRTDG